MAIGVVAAKTYATITTVSSSVAYSPTAVGVVPCPVRNSSDVPTCSQQRHACRQTTRNRTLYFACGGRLTAHLCQLPLQDTHSHSCRCVCSSHLYLNQLKHKSALASRVTTGGGADIHMASGTSVAEELTIESSSAKVPAFSTQYTC